MEDLIREHEEKYHGRPIKKVNHPDEEFPVFKIDNPEYIKAAKEIGADQEKLPPAMLHKGEQW